MPRKRPSGAKSAKKTHVKASSARPGAKPAGPGPAAGASPRAPLKLDKAAAKTPQKAAPKAAEPAKKLTGSSGFLAARAAAKLAAMPQTDAAGKPLPGAPKAAKKAAPKPKKPPVPRAAPRLKIVWAVCDHTLKTLKTFPYPERRAAELEASRLQKSKGKEHLVRAERVPMTAQPEARR